MIDSMEIKDIMEHLPHRYPFLLVDRVVSTVVTCHSKTTCNISC